MARQCLYGFLLCMIAFSATAQPEPTDTTVTLSTHVVYTEILRPHPSFKGVTIQTDSLLKNGRSSLAEVLRYNTSIFVKSYGGNGVASLSFRGTGAQHTQVYWNGLNIGSPSLGQSDFSSLNLDAGDNVELRYGLSSLVDGAGGLGGSISLNSRGNWNDTLNINLLQEVGSFKRYRTSLSVGARRKKLVTKTGYYRTTAANNFPFQNIALPDHPVQELQHSNWFNEGIYQRFHWQGNVKNYMSAQAWYNRVDRELPPLQTQAVAKDENLTDQLLNAVIDWRHFEDKSWWSVSTGISTGENSLLNYTDSFFSTISHTSWQSNAQYNQWFWGHRFSLKVNARSQLDQVVSSGFDSDVQEFRSTVAANLDYFANKWQGTILLREQLVGEAFSPLLGAFGLLYKVNKKNTVKGNVARNYRYPTLNDRYWNPGGNPGLLPEESVSYELGFTHKKRINKLYLDAEVTAFSNQVDNWILWAPTGNFWSPQNVKKVHNKGAELEFRGTVSSQKMKVDGAVSYTYTESKNVAFYVPNEAGIEQQLIYVPYHKLNGGVTVHYAGFRLNYSQQYTGRYFISTDNLSYMPAHTVADVNLSYTIPINGKQELNIACSVRNLMDWQYQTLPYRAEPGRNYAVRIAYQFKK